MQLILKIVFIAILLGIVGLFGISISYFDPDLNKGFLFSKQFQYTLVYWRIALFVHVFSSLVVIIVGFLQFLKYFQKNKKWHRILGKIYLIVLVFLAAPSGLIMGWHASGGILAKCSFILAGIFWVYFSISAYLQAKNKLIEQHTRNMVYSYALTLSAVTLRFYTMVINEMNTNINPAIIYTAIAWISWTLNLCLAYILIKWGITKKWLLQ